MQAIFAIVGLTWKAALRYRLFWVIAALLLCAVVGLPILIKDDGTAAGFAQILITYTLGAVTTLLGLCTLWLGCGTLARDVEDCQIQMLVVKPIARWQIWIGKWLGIVLLNVVLLAISGASIYGLLLYRGKGLSPEEQFKLMNEVLVARSSAREENLDARIQKETDRIFKDRLEKKKFDGMDLNAIRNEIASQVRAGFQIVEPGGTRPWIIKLGSAKDRLKGQPLYLRIKFNTPQVNGGNATYYGRWQVGRPGKTKVWQPAELMSLAPDTFHEFPIPPDLFDEKGDLIILFGNMNETALLFQLDDGMEVLYREGGFGANFVRGLAIILCWMSLLAALGLAAASLLSFPVAAFFSLSVLIISLCSSTLSTVVSDGTITGYDSEKGTSGHVSADNLVIPVFRGLLVIINLVQQFSPIDLLTNGRNITWQVLGLAFAQIVLLVGGVFMLAGIFIFNRRELATAQGTT
jgi:hypothetical protein